MIVELCNLDLLKLTSGEQIAIDDVIVRTTREDRSSVIGQVAVKPQDAKGGTSNGRSTLAKTQKPRKTGTHWIISRYRSWCAHPGCAIKPPKGSRIVYDYDNKKPYCFGHGVELLGHPDDATKEASA
jgi:hypothetical protein